MIGDSHFFESYTKGGQVNYSKIKQEGLPDLTRLTDWMANTPAQIVVEESAKWKKLYLNTYSLLVIASLIDAFPIASPLDVPGFFSGRKHLVAEKNDTGSAGKEILVRTVPGAPG